MSCSAARALSIAGANWLAGMADEPAVVFAAAPTGKLCPVENVPAGLDAALC